MSDTMTITQQAATDDDIEFLYQVYASTRAEEMSVVPWSDEQKAAFLRMQFQAQHTYYHVQYPNAHYDVLYRDDQPIGRLYVDRRPNELRILDIALLPEQCGHGIGTRLIQALMDEASTRNLPLNLHVELFNRAQRLYERLGFYRVQENGIYILMEWKPTNASL